MAGAHEEVLALELVLVVQAPLLLDLVDLDDVLVLDGLPDDLRAEPADEGVGVEEVLERHVGVEANVAEAHDGGDDDGDIALVRGLEAQVQLRAAEVGDGHRDLLVARRHVEPVLRDLRPPDAVAARLALRARVHAVAVGVRLGEARDAAGDEALRRSGVGWGIALPLWRVAGTFPVSKDDRSKCAPRSARWETGAVGRSHRECIAPAESIPIILSEGY